MGRTFQVGPRGHFKHVDQPPRPLLCALHVVVVFRSVGSGNLSRGGGVRLGGVQLRNLQANNREQNCWSRVGHHRGAKVTYGRDSTLWDRMGMGRHRGATVTYGRVSALRGEAVVNNGVGLGGGGVRVSTRKNISVTGNIHHRLGYGHRMGWVGVLLGQD